MIISTMRQSGFAAAAAGALLTIWPLHEVRAADASEWDGDARASMRLIAGSNAGAAETLRAGIEIRLGTGWKTYWRYPGDSGVPPTFDFSKSDNVSWVTVLWPAPHRFTDEGGSSIGYKGGVVLPLRVVPKDPTRPVTLRLKLDFAICEKLCMPAVGSSTLALSRGPSAQDATLAAAEASVPKPVRLGEAGPLTVRAVKREEATPHPRVMVDVEAPAGAPLDLFVEGPTDQWALPVPEPVAGPGPRRFSFELDGLPPGVDGANARLRYTLVSGSHAIEVTADLE
jgi:DsbC/DsbD-like thiol-disulfide interchange protein